MSVTSLLINDMWSLHLGIIGILVSVITMIYATLSSKVEEMKAIKNNTDYVAMIHMLAVEKSINTLRRLNLKVMRILLLSFLLFLFSTILQFHHTTWMIALGGILSLLMIGYCVYLVSNIYSQYQNETN